MQNIDIYHVGKSKKFRDIVRYVWRRRGMATRSDVARDLHLSNATVFPAIDQLTRAGILENVPLQSNAKGRKPSGLRIAGRQCFALGISLHRERAEIAALDASQQVICQIEMEKLPTKGDALFKQLLPALIKFMGANGLQASRLAGVGVVLPGFVDHKHGIVRQSSCFDARVQVPVAAFVEKALGCRCMVLSTAPVLALTEKEWGLASEMSTFLYYCGMGLGMFLDGKLFMGHQSYGGELGFMKFNDDRKPDADSRTGTFHWASPFRQVGLRLETLIKQGAETMAAAWLAEGRALSLDLIIEAALQGDALCRGLVAEGFQVEAEMMVSLNYLFNPEAIFLQPWTAQCPDISLDIVNRRLELCRVINPDVKVKAMAARHGRADLARGVAMLPLNRFLSGA